MLGDNITEKVLIAGYYEEDKSYIVELHKNKIDEILKKIFNANEIKYI